jgi:putative membrane protein
MKNSIKAAIVLTLGAGLLTAGGTTVAFMKGGAETGYYRQQQMVGNMSVDEFNRLNAQGAAAVAAITPTSGQLSSRDRGLMMEVAMGGMRQLEVSRAALEKLTNPEARILAQSEIEEQTAVSAKLREIASAKGATLPAAPDSKTQSMVRKMQGMSGAELDRNYVKESGVKGHEQLQKTMSKVQSNGTDASLKALATATMPVIQTHMQVSRQVLDKMSGKGNNGSGNTNTNMKR